jgi:uncharacterized protein
MFRLDRVDNSECAELNVTVNELLPGFVVTDKGGVVRIAELQSQGYLYLRP